MRSRSLRSLLGSCLVATACTEPAEIPDVPDLAALQARYDQPSASLDGDEVRALVDRFPELERFARALRAADPLLANVDGARDAAAQRETSGVDLRGALTVDVTCPGLSDEPGFEATSSGSLSLELAVEGGVIKQTLWGMARRCVLRGALGPLEFPIEIDGPLAIDLGAPISLRRRWQRGRTLVSVLGSIAFGPVTLRDVSARYGPDSFEHLQDTDAGSVVLFVTDDGIGLRDHDATWLCQRGATACGVR